MSNIDIVFICILFGITWVHIGEAKESPQCYTKTMPPASHTWHPIKCPTGLGVIK